MKRLILAALLLAGLASQASAQVSVGVTGGAGSISVNFGDAPLYATPPPVVYAPPRTAYLPSRSAFLPHRPMHMVPGQRHMLAPKPRPGRILPRR